MTIKIRVYERVPVTRGGHCIEATSIAVFAILLVLLTQAGTAFARASATAEPLILASKAGSKKTTAPARTTDKPPPQAHASIMTAASTGPGQAGYVHYFVITGPDGEPESHVGLELAGNLIAWSFPELGVVVAPFISSGVVTANGKSYEVEHLYGIRPFPGEEPMRALQREVAARVRMWVEEKTPYCDEALPSNARCLSCLGFVLRVLYPGPTRAFPAMPSDFKTAKKNVYTTEDFLLYLAGVSLDETRAERLKRIETLAIPQEMREELVRLASIDTPRPAVANPRPTTRAVVQLPKRVLPRRGS